MKLDIKTSRAYTYPNQTTKQGRYYQIGGNGITLVDVNAEIGNAVPIGVWEGRAVRISIPVGWTRKQIEGFYADNKANFTAIGNNIAKNGKYVAQDDNNRDALDLAINNA